MKIKNVEITGFRAYENPGDGSFDFSMPSGEIAEFISIYAPNGFGKSSFYDAIEWAMTNNISRYIRDALRTNNDKTSLILNNLEAGQRILRNRYIDDDAPSHVNVETTLKRSFFRKVPNARANSRDYAYDKKNTSPVTKHLAEIFLAQDAIDAFLKEDRPELRYEKFMSGFGGDDELYRQKLHTIRKSTEEEIKSLNDEIAKLQLIIDDPIHKIGLDQVNLTIQNLSSNGEAFDPIASEYSPVIDIEYKNKIAQLMAEKINQIDIAKENIDLINNCLSSIPDAERNIKSIESIRVKLKALEENRLKLDVINGKNNQIRDLEVVVAKKCEERTQLERNAVNLESFLKSRATFLQAGAEKASLDYKKDEIVSELRGVTKEIEDKQAQLSQLNTEHFKIQQDIQIAPVKFREMLLNERQITSDQMKLEALKRRIDTSISTSVALSNEADRVQRIPETHEIIHTSALASLGASQEFILSFSDKLNSLQSAQKNNDSVMLEVDIIGKKNQEYFELVTLANNIISHTHSNLCPVCDSKFNSFEELSAKILSNENINGQQQYLAARLEQAKYDLECIEDSIRDDLILIKSLKNRKISEINESLSIAANAADTLNLEKENLEHQIELLQRRVEVDKQFFNGLSLEEFIAKCNTEVNENRVRKSATDESLATLSSVAVRFKNNISELSLKIEQYRSLIDEFDKTGSNRDIINYLNSNAVAHQDAEDFFTKRTIELNEQIEAARNAIAEAKVVIHRISEDIHKSAGMVDSEVLERDTALLREDFKRTEESHIQFCARLESLSVQPEDASNWRSSLENLRVTHENTIDRSRNTLKNLEILQLQLKDVLPFIEYSNAKEKLIEKQQLLSKYNILNLKLNEEFQSIERNLQHLISSFFYTDLINNIYRKIDPHPTFKKVKFECIFSESEKPRLEVYLYDSDDRRISPNLYFSAAQLNILSLSIFLARALHVEHEGSPVETILIDDPIHSMDSINILSTIDLLRNISVQFNRQIILSTHDENFFELLKTKLPSDHYRSKFIKLESYGKVERS